MFENVRADLGRFRPGAAGGGSTRQVVRGLLSQGFHALIVYRFFSCLQRNGIPSQPIRFAVERMIEVTAGISIPAACDIGPGMRIHHFGGIILHPTTRIGERCTLYHGVTIGDRGGSGRAATIGDDVLLGAGSKLIGEISIGHRCIVGANAVVRESMPDDHVAIGNPAEIVPRRSSRPEPARVG